MYTKRVVDVNLNQVVPTCEINDGRVIPLVEDDVECVRAAVSRATHGVVLKTENKLWAAFVRELKPNLTIYTWGVSARGRNIVPIYSGRYRGAGVYYVRDNRELELIKGKSIDGVLLDAEGFNPYLVELIVRNRIQCCVNCDIVERLTCMYREVEII